MNNGKRVALLLMVIMTASAFAGCIGESSTDAVDAVLGCTYEDADNYESTATDDDGSCTWSDDEDEHPPIVGPDVDCNAFTAPTEDNEAVIGEPDANGLVELLVEPGFVSVIIDCYDENGNTGMEVTVTTEPGSMAGDPAARLSSSGTEGRDVPVFGCWVVYPNNPHKHWVIPCPVRDIVVGGLEPIPVIVDANPGTGAHGLTSISLVVNWSLLGPWNDPGPPDGHEDDADHLALNPCVDDNGVSLDICTGVFVIDVVPVNSTVDCYNRCISGWAGKVNQHIFNGTWMTDPDGVSGWHNSTEYATGYFDRKVEYCQKWWPDTTSVQLRTFRETLAYYNAGNPEPPFPSTRNVYDCLVMEAVDTDGDGLSDWDELNIYNTNATNPDTDGDGVSDGDEVNNGTDPLDPDCKSPTGWKDESASNREAEPDRCWRDTREREEYSVTTEREDDNKRTIRTFTRWSIGPGVYTIRAFTISVPVATWYWLCPSHYTNTGHQAHGLLCLR